MSAGEEAAADGRLPASRQTGGPEGLVETQFATFDEPLELEAGGRLDQFELAWEQYGELNAAADNCVLLFHALTGSQHAAGFNAQVPKVGDLWTDEMHEGWWQGFIGPGKALDTDRFCVVCANYIGGCYGSTGPTSVDPATGRPYGATFPNVRFIDSVRAQLRLLDRLGVERLHAAIGPSTGGMACLSLASLFPERVDSVVIVASGQVTTPLQRIHNYEQVQAIENDPAWERGDYAPGTRLAGLGIARQICHKTFVSLGAMERRARKSVTAVGDSWYGVHHPLESYMLHQADKFVRRFDANSYLRILDAWSQFDLLAESGASSFEELFQRCRDHQFLVFSINSDVCYYPGEQAELVATLEASGVSSMRIIVDSEKGHDSFLVEPELYEPHLGYLLTRRGKWRRRGAS